MGLINLDEVINMKEPPLLFKRPIILESTPIPIALHGVNPRTIRGKKWWDEERRRVYKENNYHCWCCGVWARVAPIRQWLEAHEMYRVSTKTGRVSLKEVVGLCHSCHNFIHIGRLLDITMKGEVRQKDAKAIVKHGLEIVRIHNLRMTVEQLNTAERILGYLLNTKIYRKRPSYNYDLPWNKWHLVIGRKRYYSQFSGEQEHADFYNRK